MRRASRRTSLAAQPPCNPIYWQERYQGRYPRWSRSCRTHGRALRLSFQCAQTRRSKGSRLLTPVIEVWTAHQNYWHGRPDLARAAAGSGSASWRRLAQPRKNSRRRRADGIRRWLRCATSRLSQPTPWRNHLELPLRDSKSALILPFGNSVAPGLGAKGWVGVVALMTSRRGRCGHPRGWARLDSFHRFSAQDG